MMKRGITYFRWWGFSVNEGRFPNIHVSWCLGGDWHLFWYVCLGPKLRWHN